MKPNMYQYSVLYQEKKSKNANKNRKIENFEKQKKSKVFVFLMVKGPLNINITPISEKL